MKKLLSGFGLVVIFLAGCDFQPHDFSKEVDASGPVKVMPAMKPTSTPTPVATAQIRIPKEVRETGSVQVLDMTDAQGRPMLSGDGKPMKIAVKKHHKRHVVHQVKKGFWIGGEK